MEYQVKKYIGLEGREGIEWSNFWYDQANTNTQHRVLLVGDSTSRMVRSAFAKKLGLPVDLFATSSALDDQLFINQLHCFFDESIYKYDVIFVQLGHHARTNKLGQDYQECDFLKFRKDLKMLIKYLKQFSDKVVLETIFYSVKPQNKFVLLLEKLGIIKEKYDMAINSHKDRKNIIIKEIALETGCDFCDINKKMLGTRYIHKDHIHYESSARSVIISLLSEYVKLT